MAEATPTSPNNPSSPQDTSTHSSLFPISSETTITTISSASQWLYSSSFNTDLSVINNAVSSFTTYNSNDEDEREPIQEPSSTPYGYLESSESDKEKERKKKQKSRKKRKRAKVKIDEFAYGARKSGVRAWANSDTKPNKDYYFDSRGDPDNLAFGCLYRMDIGRYKLLDVARSTGVDFQRRSRLSAKVLMTREEVDEDGLDAKLKSSGRYWSAKHSVLEYHRNFKRIRIVAPDKRVHVSCDDFIPLLDEDGDASLLSRASVIVESWEDEIFRKTREFNKMAREHPHNVRVWLDFAEFQDKIANKQPQKGARLQTLEKKISILEKASELNPENEDLLLSLLKAYHSRDSADVLIGRWEKVLMQHPGSVKLWREFLRVVQGEFSTFKISELRKMYAHAIQALYAACSKGHRQVHPTVEQSSPETVDSDLELGIVDIFLSLCRFEWQAGYHELATALLQAEIEYSLFYPPLQLTEQSKKRLFEHFWNSNGARVGEDGAIGWSSWLEKEEENRQNLMQEMPVKEDKEGGWTGWFVPLSKDKEHIPNLEEHVITDVVMEEMEEQDVKKDEDDAALLRMLGIDVDAEASREVHDTTTWVRWSEEELSRDHDQWMPVHTNSGVSHIEDVNEEEQEQLSRVILFEDVNDYLFSLSSADARLSLVLQFIDFFDGEMFCTNSSCWDEKMLSLEMLPNSILRYLRRVNSGKILESGSSALSLESLLHRSETVVRSDVMKFLRNAGLLCLRVFPRNYKVEEAILIAEEQSIVAANTLLRGTPSQVLAKHLLKCDRQDVLLCGVYARREAAYRNIDHARKVFDMALSSISGLPLETQSIAAPLLYLWYSEMEIVDNCSDKSESTPRALHILSCLGTGITYTPYKGHPPSTQLLRAHQGFKERINTIRSSLARHCIDESSVAFICSASLFEELTAGWVAGAEVITDALSMVLPEKKSQSNQLEFLFNYQVRMLQRHHPQTTFSTVLQYVSAGLRVYPSNPELLCCLVNLGHQYTVPNKLRQIFDDLFQKKPSAILWLSCLSYELSIGAPQQRIHGLFERAVSDDRLRTNVVLWRYYISYEIHVLNFSAARRMLWLDGFKKLHTVINAKELLDLHEVMRDKELNLRTDIYEILLQDEFSYD
ncbi:Protein NRDE2-like protein [Bienertia sinuspersici]